MKIRQKSKVKSIVKPEPDVRVRWDVTCKTRKELGRSRHGHGLPAKMFAVRRLRIQARPPTLWRGNVTLQNQPSPSAIPPQDRSKKTEVKPATTEATPETPVRLPRKGLRRNSRPKISLDAPRRWNRALAPGILPVYDYALQLIKADSVKLKKEAEGLREVIKDTEARIGRVGRHERSEEEVEEDDRVLNDCRKRLEILEIQSEINLPSVRWECTNAMGMYI